MKRFFIAIAVLCGFISCSPKATEFPMKQGVNIGEWLSQSYWRNPRRAEVFTETDVKFLKDNGFDHLRFPVDEMQFFNDDMTVNESTFELIDRTINLCIKYDMRVIFDLHVIRSHSFLSEDNALFSDPAQQEKFLNMWRTIQSRLCQYPVNYLAYEILNEAMAKDDAEWADLLLKVVAMIRETEKDRIIVLGANRQNNVAHVKNIKVPEGDKNIILSFHFYEPLLITHYQAGWTVLRNLKFNGEMQYPGQLIPDSVYAALTDEEKEIVAPYNHSYDKDWIRATWKEAIDFAKSKGLRLYLGEFGCMKTVGEKMRLAWLKDVVDVARENNIPYSMWEYNSQFGFAIRYKNGEIHNRPLMEVFVK